MKSFDCPACRVVSLAPFRDTPHAFCLNPHCAAPWWQQVINAEIFLTITNLQGVARG